MMSFLSRLGSLGIYSLLGLSAFAVIIWYFGPIIRFAAVAPLYSVSSRVILIVIIFAIWGLVRLIKWLIGRKKDKDMSDGLADSGDSNADMSDEEIAELKDRFDEAVKTLRSSGKGNKAKSLYQLPWYMIIGPPGSGKTTLLVNSGLRFPLAEKGGQNSVQGIGGTRYCDWWFTDDAVMIDTAGRYTTQDSNEEVDNASWLGFLKLLKKNRARRPINGIIIAISIEELARQSEIDRERNAKAITQRIQELYEQLGVRFPIYLMFTKCDLLAGFMEYFGDLDRNEREQVWGFTYGIKDDSLQQFRAEFDGLEKQLEARLVQRLQSERDPQRRDLIYNFPQQFSSTKELLDDFLNRVFKSSRYMANPFLRGIYFTSGTQEGTPFNRIMGQLARNFGLSRAATQTRHQKGKSFFIHDLLTSVIFGESGLAGANLKVERLYGLLRKSSYMMMIAVPLLVLILWSFSYINNKGYINDVEAATTVVETQSQQVSPQNAAIFSVLPLLNEARAMPGGYNEQEQGTPIMREFGLDQSGKLGERGAVPAYERLLEGAFLPRLMVRLEQQMKNSLNEPEMLYQALKVYLMLDLPERMDTDVVRSFVTDDWDRELTRIATTEQLAQMHEHLDALLAMDPLVLPMDLDRNLVSTARDLLSRTTVSQRIYTVIKSRHGDEGKDFSLQGAAGEDGHLVFVRTSGASLGSGIPALFSPPGYHQMFLPSMTELVSKMEDETWIFAVEAADTGQQDNNQLMKAILDLYVKDYINEWNTFLGDVGIRPFRDLSQAAEILGLLSDEAKSPLRELLQAASLETTLAPEQSEGDSSLAGRIEGMFTNDIAGSLDPSGVDREFRDLHRLVDAPEGRASQLDGLFADLNDLFIFVNSMTRKSNDSMLADMQGEVNAALLRLRVSAQRAPGPVSDWVLGLASATNDLVAGGAMSAINGAWSAEVAPFCRQAVAGRYPFDQSADREVALQDFGQFFGVDGTLDKFFQEYLVSLVDTTSRSWQVKSSVADSISLNSASLRQLKRAKDIQRAFFMQGGKMPAISFDLRPTRMDASTTHFMLNVDGQRTTYSHGPIMNQTFKWPGNTGFSQVQFQFTPPTASGQSGNTVPGPWAWFRLLDKSSVSETSVSELFEATFSLDERWVTYELRANSAFNPFNLPELRAFRCPDRL
jgi:type VI secretion system protein ImpL